MTKKQSDKIARTLEGMYQAFLVHHNLLGEFGRRAFANGEPNLEGEVAGKIRLLACRTKMNVPLLLELMARTGLEFQIHLSRSGFMRNPDGTLPKQDMTIDEYLDEYCFGVRHPSDPGKFVELSRRKLVLCWAEQHGSSHEDWETDPALVGLFTLRAFINGTHVSTKQLGNIASHIWGVGEKFRIAYEQQKASPAAKAGA